MGSVNVLSLRGDRQDTGHRRKSLNHENVTQGRGHELSQYCDQLLPDRDAASLCPSPKVPLLTPLWEIPTPRSKSLPAAWLCSIPRGSPCAPPRAMAGEGLWVLPIKKNQARLHWEAARHRGAVGTARGSGEVGQRLKIKKKFWLIGRAHIFPI